MIPTLRYITTLLMLLVAFIISGGCAYRTPEQGQEAVLIDYPWFFGDGGIRATPINTGSWLGWSSTNAVYVNMQPQRIDLIFDDLMTKTGVPIDFHAVVTCKVLDSVKLVTDFGADYMEGANKSQVPGWFVRNLDQPFRTAVRDSVKKHDMQEMAITATASEEVDAEVSGHLTTLIKDSGVPVECRDLSLGRANPPDAIKTQRIETAAQEQRIQTETQRKLAEDQRKLAEESRASADAAYNLRMNQAGGANLPPELSLRLKDIEMKREVCSRSNCTFWFGEQPQPVATIRQ